jgi:hypothetical protein
MPLRALSAAMLHVAVNRSHLGEILEGRALWDLVAEARGRMEGIEARKAESDSVP